MTTYILSARTPRLPSRPWLVQCCLPAAFAFSIFQCFLALAICPGSWASRLLFSGSSLVSLMALVLAGSILGFLLFNFSPATIFLGDCGSLFIGFMLSALALQGAQKAPTLLAGAIPVVSFGLPILETALSIVRRFLGGRPV